jgi:hypothetical protein
MYISIGIKVRKFKAVAYLSSIEITIYLVMFSFSKKYFLLTSLLLAIEIFIAAYMHDPFIRPYFGDFLVVILLYCFAKSFINISVWKAAIGVLLFAYLIEMMQYFQLAKLLGLQNSKLARIIIGSSFGWEDILAYTLGIIAVLLLERKKITYRGDPARSQPGK